MKIHQLIALLIVAISSQQLSHAIIVRQMIFKKMDNKVKRIVLEGDSHRPDGVLAQKHSDELIETFSKARKIDPKTYLYLEQPESRYMPLYMSLDTIINKYSQAVVEESDHINKEATYSPKRATFLKDVLDKAHLNGINTNRSDELLFKLGSRVAHSKNTFFLDNRVVFFQMGNVFMLGHAASMLKGYKAHHVLLKEIENNSLTFKEFFEFIDSFMSHIETTVERLKNSVKESSLRQAMLTLSRLVPHFHSKIKALESYYVKDEKFFSWAFAQFEKEEHSPKLSENVSTLARMFIELNKYFVELFDMEVLSMLANKTSGTHIIVTGHQHGQDLADELHAEDCIQIHDSSYHVKDGKIIQRIEDVFHYLKLDDYSEIEAVKMLQSKVLPLPVNELSYPLLSDAELSHMRQGLKN